MTTRPPDLDFVLRSAGPWLERCYPAEGCGLVVDDGKRRRFVPCDNLAARARTSFELDPIELLRAEDRGEEVVALVHSHPDGDASLSPRDVEAMTMDGGGDRRVATFPGVWHVVVAVAAGRCVSARAYAIGDDEEVLPAEPRTIAG